MTCLFESDGLLTAYLCEKDERLANVLAERLVVSVTPLIEKIVGNNLRCFQGNQSPATQMQDLPDIRQEIVLRILIHFRALRKKAPTVFIKDCQAYIATVSFNCCYEYKRRKHPQRFRLKKKLQYLCTHHPAFGLWQDESKEWMGGLREWGGNLKHWQILEWLRVEQLMSNKLPKDLQNLPDSTFKRNSAAEQLTVLFNWSQKFIHFGDLVSIFQRWWNVSDEVMQFDDNTCNQIRNQGGTAERVFENTNRLKSVWSEIALLPVAQRKALLLNLRDSRDRELVTLLPVLEIASLRDIARTLEITPEWLGQVWNTLPLNDEQIANVLGLQRRQVINLRRAARERLARRLSLP